MKGWRNWNPFLRNESINFYILWRLLNCHSQRRYYSKRIIGYNEMCLFNWKFLIDGRIKHLSRRCIRIRYPPTSIFLTYHLCVVACHRKIQGSVNNDTVREIYVFPKYITIRWSLLKENSVLQTIWFTENRIIIFTNFCYVTWYLFFRGVGFINNVLDLK